MEPAVSEVLIVDSKFTKVHGTYEDRHIEYTVAVEVDVEHAGSDARAHGDDSDSERSKVTTNDPNLDWFLDDITSVDEYVGTVEPGGEWYVKAKLKTPSATVASPSPHEVETQEHEHAGERTVPDDATPGTAAEEFEYLLCAVRGANFAYATAKDDEIQDLMDSKGSSDLGFTVDCTTCASARPVGPSGEEAASLPTAPREPGEHHVTEAESSVAPSTEDTLRSIFLSTDVDGNDPGCRMQKLEF